jgi:hypothetical protein
LTSRSLAGIASCVRTGCELGHGNGADSEFVWELPCADLIQIDHDRRVNQAPRRTRSLSHEV